MFAFNKEDAIQKLASEKDFGRTLASAMIEQLEKVELPELQPYIESWYNGETPSFKFVGISSDDIIKKEKESYVGAILRMNRLIQDPEFREWYKKTNFSRL